MRKMEDRMERMERCLEKMLGLLEKGVVNRDSEARVKEEEASEESRAYMVSFLNTSLDSNYVCIVVCIQLLLYIHVQ